MRRLIGAASRRTAGIAAGLILTGGVVGGVLLAPGAAYADTGTTVAITSASPSFGGVTVSVSVTGGTEPLGTFSVSGAGNGCTGNLSGGGVFGGGMFGNPGGGDGNGGGMFGKPGGGDGSGSGSCTIDGVGPGTYSLTASYDGATGTGSVTVPQNNYGSADASPFTVSSQNDVYRHRQHHNEFADLSTSLSCTSPVHTGQRGQCTLDVANDGYGSAPDVTAQITLPYQLRADYCGYYDGCSISGNTASEDLGALDAGQTRELTVTFTADNGYTLWGRHHGRTFTVQVDGSASSYGNFGTYSYHGQRDSSSTAYVTVIPRGFWW
jgi:hypothetical protein